MRGLPEAPDPELERLYICELGLTSLPAWLGSLTRLRTLDLGHNRLAGLPDLSGLASLEILYLHDNALTAVPAWIGALRALTYLNVSENPLGSLPPELGRLGGLIELRALDAELSGLPALDGLVSLRELHLRRNRFTALPESVRALRSLRLLDLRSNRLEGLPGWIAELPDLQKLDLRWNEPVLEPPRALLERGCVVLTE